MSKFIKAAILSYTACVLKNGNSRLAQELIYLFPLDSPIMKIHADLWVPGNSSSFDGYISLMIILCHMTGFSAIEYVTNATS